MFAANESPPYHGYLRFCTGADVERFRKQDQDCFFAQLPGPAFDAVTAFLRLGNESLCLDLQSKWCCLDCRHASRGYGLLSQCLLYEILSCGLQWPFVARRGWRWSPKRETTVRRMLASPCASYLCAYADGQLRCRTRVMPVLIAAVNRRVSPEIVREVAMQSPDPKAQPLCVFNGYQGLSLWSELEMERMGGRAKDLHTAFLWPTLSPHWLENWTYPCPYPCTDYEYEHRSEEEYP